MHRLAVPPVYMLVSTYLSPRTRERLVEAGMSYADATGNLRFTVDRPAVFIETQGADKNPFRVKRPLHSLKGRRAARVARGLLDYRPPFGTRELAAEIASSAAMVSRVCRLLEQEEIVTKASPRGRIVAVDWEALVRRWAVDYDFASANALTTWLEPRGSPALFARLRDARIPIHRHRILCRVSPRAHVPEPRLVTVYADDPETVAEAWGLAAGRDGRQCAACAPIRPRGV